MPAISARRRRIRTGGRCVPENLPSLVRRQGQLLLDIAQGLRQRDEPGGAGISGAPEHPRRPETVGQQAHERPRIGPREGLLTGNLIVPDLGVDVRVVGEAQYRVETRVGRRLGHVGLAGVVHDHPHLRMALNHAGQRRGVLRQHVELEDRAGGGGRCPEVVVLRRVYPPGAARLAVVVERVKAEAGQPLSHPPLQVTRVGGTFRVHEANSPKPAGVPFQALDHIGIVPAERAALYQDAVGDVVLRHILEQPLHGSRGGGWGQLGIGGGPVARRIVQRPHVDVGIYSLAFRTVLHHILLHHTCSATATKSDATRGC